MLRDLEQDECLVWVLDAVGSLYEESTLEQGGSQNLPVSLALLAPE